MALSSPFFGKNGEIPEAIQELFIEFIKPSTILHEFKNIIEKEEFDKLQTIVRNEGDRNGAHYLLKELIKKDNWFPALLEILPGRHVKLQHIAELMKEEMKFFQCVKSSLYAGQYGDTRLALPTSAATIYIKYNNDLEKQIRDLFLAYVEQGTELLAFHKYSDQVLTQVDIENVQAEMKNYGTHVGNVLLLSRLILYEDWFQILINVLLDPEIKLDHVANAMKSVTLHTRQQYQDNIARTLQEYSKFYSDEKRNNRNMRTDSADGGQVQNTAKKRCLTATEEYESDGAEIRSGTDVLTFNDHNAVISMSTTNIDLPIHPEVDLETDENSRKTALMTAAEDGDIKALKDLISCTVLDEVDVNRRTALMYAAKQGQAECVGLLIHNGCDVNKKDCNGDTALMFACKYEHADCVEILISGQAEVDAVSKSGATALLLTAMTGNVACMSLLLEGKCNPNKPDKDGLTPLMHAAKCDRSECIRLLIKFSCNVNKDTCRGKTALMFAAEKGHSDCIKLLIGSKCNVNHCDKNGRTALIYAIENKHSSCTELLIRMGTDVDRLDVNGNTAVMSAVQHQDSKCLASLITSHAKLGVVNKAGYTPLKYAKEKGYTKCVELLERSTRRF